jgi:hypothetical protein
VFRKPIVAVERRIDVNQSCDAIGIARAQYVHFFAGERMADNDRVLETECIHDAHDILGEARETVAGGG